MAKTIGKIINFVSPRLYQKIVLSKIEKRFKKVTDVEQEIINNYFKRFNYHLNLSSPKTFYEKMNYLKLYQSDEKFSNYVDKISAKEIAQSMNSKIKISKTLFVFNNVISFKKELSKKTFPKECVIKMNHTSGDVFFYRENHFYDKYGSCISKRKVFAILEYRLKLNYYHTNFERCYKPIQPRIIVEEFFQSLSGIPEYKFFCNYGVPKMVNVVYDRQAGSRVREAFTDENLCIFPVHQDQPLISQEDIFQPKCWDEMLCFVKKVSKDFPFLRVDLMTDGTDFYFCEFTFYDFGGNAIFYPLEWDTKIGDLFDFSKIEKYS